MLKRDTAEPTLTADKSDPYEHTHVYVDMGKIFQSTSSRIFDHPCNYKIPDGGRKIRISDVDRINGSVTTDPLDEYKWLHPDMIGPLEEAMDDRKARHPNIKKIVSKEHRLNVYKYLAKEDHDTPPYKRLEINILVPSIGQSVCGNNDLFGYEIDLSTLGFNQ